MRSTHPTRNAHAGAFQQSNMAHRPPSGTGGGHFGNTSGQANNSLRGGNGGLLGSLMHNGSGLGAESPGMLMGGRVGGSGMFDQIGAGGAMSADRLRGHGGMRGGGGAGGAGAALNTLLGQGSGAGNGVVRHGGGGGGTAGRLFGGGALGGRGGGGGAFNLSEFAANCNSVLQVIMWTGVAVHWEQQFLGHGNAFVPRTTMLTGRCHPPDRSVPECQHNLRAHTCPERITPLHAPAGGS